MIRIHPYITGCWTHKWFPGDGVFVVALCPAESFGALPISLLSGFFRSWPLLFCSFLQSLCDTRSWWIRLRHRPYKIPHPPFVLAPGPIVPPPSGSVPGLCHHGHGVDSALENTGGFSGTSWCGLASVLGTCLSWLSSCAHSTPGLYTPGIESLKQPTLRSPC